MASAVSGGCFEWLLGAGVVKGAGSAKSAQFASDWEVKNFLVFIIDDMDNSTLKLRLNILKDTTSTSNSK